MNILHKIRKFMHGRYGIDDLYMFLLFIYILLSLVNIFTKNYIITIIEIIILIIMIHRFLSKNIYRRSNENKIYISIKNKIMKPIKKYIKYIKLKYTNRKDNIYKKCKYCKKNLKLPIPYERGIKKVKCPSCKKMNKYLIIKKQKVEVIKRSENK